MSRKLGLGRLMCRVRVRSLSPCPLCSTLRSQAELDWIAPMMPVIYPEDCQPGSWQMDHPACNRSRVWQDEAPPPAVADPSKRNSFCIQVREHSGGAACGL